MSTTLFAVLGVIYIIGFFCTVWRLSVWLRSGENVDSAMIDYVDMTSYVLAPWWPIFLLVLAIYYGKKRWNSFRIRRSAA